MQIEIDPRSDVAIYQQLHDRIVEAVATGDLVPGEQLASVRQVALSFGINVATVTKAYDTLRQDGFIRTNHKSGSTIARGPATSPPDARFLAAWKLRLTTLLAEAVAHGVPQEDVLESARSITAEFAAARDTHANRGIQPPRTDSAPQKTQ